MEDDLKTAHSMKEGASLKLGLKIKYKKQKMNWRNNGHLTFFDLETTGMSPTKNRIIEIGAVRIENDGTETYFNSLVNPGVHVPDDVVSVHGISDQMLIGAPPFSEVGKAFLRFASDSVLIAHNALFDLAFLQESLKRDSLGIWDGKTIDSLKLSKKVVPGLASYSLAYLEKYFGLDEEKNIKHRALSDAKTLMKIFSILANIPPPKG
jgi:DNA polymerase III epsilon subunit